MKERRTEEIVQEILERVFKKLQERIERVERKVQDLSRQIEATVDWIVNLEEKLNNHIKKGC